VAQGERVGCEEKRRQTVMGQRQANMGDRRASAEMGGDCTVRAVQMERDGCTVRAVQKRGVRHM
jgi:hypothetical protein